MVMPNRYGTNMTPNGIIYRITGSQSKRLDPMMDLNVVMAKEVFSPV